MSLDNSPIRLRNGDSYTIQVDPFQHLGPNLILNPDFTGNSDAHWHAVGGWSAGAFVEQTVAWKVTHPTGGGATFDIFIGTTPGVPSNGVYLVTFDAKASMAKTISFGMQAVFTAAVTTDWKNFQQLMTMTTNPTEQLNFGLGGFSGGFDFYIDNVFLRKVVSTKRYIPYNANNHKTF